MAQPYYRPRMGIGPRRDQFGQPVQAARANPSLSLSPQHDSTAFDSFFHPAAAQPALGSPSAVAPVMPKAPTRAAAPAGMPDPTGVASGAGAAMSAAIPMGLSVSPLIKPRPSPVMPDAYMATRAPVGAPSVPSPSLTAMTPGGARGAGGMVTPQYAEAATARTAQAMREIDANRDAYHTQLANGGRMPAPAVQMSAAPAPAAPSPIQLRPDLLSQRFQTPYGMVSVSRGMGGDGTQDTGAPGTLAAMERAKMQQPMATTAFDSSTPISGAAVPPTQYTPASNSAQGPTQSGVPLDAYESAQQRGQASATAQQAAVREQQQSRQVQQVQQTQAERAKVIEQQAKIAVTSQASAAKAAELEAATTPNPAEDRQFRRDQADEDSDIQRRKNAGLIY